MADVAINIAELAGSVAAGRFVSTTFTNNHVCDDSRQTCMCSRAQCYTVHTGTNGTTTTLFFSMNWRNGKRTTGLWPWLWCPLLVPIHFFPHKQNRLFTQSATQRFLYNFPKRLKPTNLLQYHPPFPSSPIKIPLLAPCSQPSSSVPFAHPDPLWYTEIIRFLLTRFL